MKNAREGLPRNRNRERNKITDYRNQAEYPVTNTQEEVGGFTICPGCGGSGKTSSYTQGKSFTGDCSNCNGIGRLIKRR